MLSWVDGLPAVELSVRDRGLAYGDGLFETLAVRAGVPRLLERHLARLEEGARRLSIPLDGAALHQELLAFCALLGDGVAKLILTRGDALRGYAPPANASPRRILSGSPRSSYPGRYWREGVRLFACRTRLAAQPLLAGLKHLNRLEQVLARAEWSDDEHAEGLMLDTTGRVVEGVFSNLLLVCDGTLIAPDLRRCGVAGVMRAELLERAGNMGIPRAIQDVSLAELTTADEVFLCNSQFGIWPVRALDEHVWPVGELTRKLQDQLRDDLDF